MPNTSCLVDNEREEKRGERKKKSSEISNNQNRTRADPTRTRSTGVLNVSLLPNGKFVC
jgi:hypothetical protein